MSATMSATVATILVRFLARCHRVYRSLRGWLVGVAIVALIWTNFGAWYGVAWAAPTASTSPSTSLSDSPVTDNVTNNAQAQLVSEVKSVQPGQPFWVALHVQIREGWHVYWQNPGDSGAAPIVKWNLPDGFKAGELVYPYPERLAIAPLMNFGYKDEVYYLTEITPAANVAAGNPVILKATADILVCEMECIPEQKTLALTLPVTTDAPALDSVVAPAFARTRQALPQPSPWQATVALEAQTLRLQVAAPGLQAGQVTDVQFFPYQDGVIENAAPQTMAIDRNGITLTVKRGYQDKLATVEGVLVLRETLDTSVTDSQVTTQAFAIQAIPGTALESGVTTTPASIAQTLLLALLGGIVLNLMPCVFPVLSLKALTIAQQAQQSPRQARMGGVAFTAGVLVSFALVAGVLLILRGVGQQIGWGFQLQSPVFVLLMAYVLFAVGLSLSGVFTVGASIMGLGHGLTARSGYTGEFFTGILTTVMATPCTAPFMATAVSVALVQPAWIAIAILLTLGLGLALPYLLISVTPALRRWLPKPGAWMEILQQLLAFPMYGAAAWLVWVLTQQSGTDGLAIALGGMVLLGFAAWLHQKTQMSRQAWRRVGTVGSLAAIVLALTLTPLVHNSPLPTAQGDAANPRLSIWQSYSAQKLATLQQSNQPVFINFTAAWCVTCLVNDRVALSQPEVITAFQEKGVTLIKADWTNRNPEITQALSQYGRSGVPLYVFYPAGLAQGNPTILPQVLTPAIVQDALQPLSAQATHS